MIIPQSHSHSHTALIKLIHKKEIRRITCFLSSRTQIKQEERERSRERERGGGENVQKMEGSEGFIYSAKYLRDDGSGVGALTTESGFSIVDRATP